MKLKKLLALAVSAAMALSIIPVMGISAGAASLAAERITEYGWDLTGGTTTAAPYLVSWNNNRHPFVSFRINGFDKDSMQALAKLSFTSNLNNGTGGATTGTIFAVDPAAVEAKTQSALSAAVANKVKLGTVYVGINGTVTTDNLDITDCISEDGKVAFYLSNREEDGCYSYGISTLTSFALSVEAGEASKVKIVTEYYDGENLVDRTEESSGTIFIGDTYTYSGAAMSVKHGEGTYLFDEAGSSLSTTVLPNGASSVTLVYRRYNFENTFSGYEVDDEGAWCWFADPRSISYKNADGSIDISILGYIDVHGNIKATQINHNTDTVDEVLIRSNIQPDDHNNPTFLVLPDERIIVFYSRHTDEACFWYRVTKEKGDLTTLGEEKCLNTSANTTYPSPFLMENDPTHIYLCWRGINWHPTIAKLDIPDEDGNTRFVYGPYQMVQSTGARPYAKYASNGVDKIYVTYTTGHPDNEQPNWVYFNAINISDMTLEDVNGNTLSTIANGPLSVNKTNTSQSFIVDTAPGNMRDWVWQTAIGADGKPVIAMVRISGGKTSHDYYYVKWNGSEWTATFLANGGGSFHQSPGLEMCYSGGMAIDPDNTNVIYCSVPVEGIFGSVYEIIKYTLSDDGTEVIATEAVTNNSLKNNVRPFVIPDSVGRDIRLIWMNGDYYDWIVSNAYTTQGYCTAVMAEKPIPSNAAKTDDATVCEDYAAIGGAFVSTTETANIVEASASGAFSVSADVYLEKEGQILDLGSVKLGVETRDTQYGATVTGERKRVVLTVNGTEYVTSNVYGTSDCWKTYGRGTGGNYGVSDYEGYVNLTLTYDGKYLTLYRDGLVDAKIEAAALSVDNVKVGGFGGMAENVSVYERALSRDDIKALADADYVVEEPAQEGSVSVTCNYVDDEGNEILPSKTVTLNAGTDIYTFKPEKEMVTAAGIYALDEEKSVLEGSVVTAVYRKSATIRGENLVPSGSFEDENGSFDWGTWQSPRGDGYFKNICSDWFYKVNRDTNASVLYPEDLAASDYALGTRWNDGTAGLCSMANFIPVKGGRTYYVSYDYKHTTAGTNASTIRTTFQTTAALSADDSKDNHTPSSVTTDWQTNGFTITAPEDGYIYFHFYWLGSGGSTNTGSNSGSGPYWYFDNFSVRELAKTPDIAVSINSELTSEDNTVITFTNKTKSDIAGIKVYAASFDTDEEMKAVKAKTLDIAAGEAKDVSFGIGGKVRVFIWDENMRPICEDVFEN